MGWLVSETYRSDSTNFITMHVPVLISGAQIGVSDTNRAVVSKSRSEVGVMVRTPKICFLGRMTPVDRQITPGNFFEPESCRFPCKKTLMPKQGLNDFLHRNRQDSVAKKLGSPGKRRMVVKKT